MTECSGCGQCCQAIPLPETQEEVRRKLPWQIEPRTRRWILEDLVQLSPREVRRVAPWRFAEIELQRDPSTGEWVADYPTFYRCLNYDEETRRCLIYEDRPPTCSDFPFYGPDHTVPYEINLPPRCSFRADIGQPVEEWTPVEIRR